MTVTEVPQKMITQTIDAVQWMTHGDDVEAAAETRKPARECGPGADRFASAAQRVRAASVLLEVGEFLSSEAKETGAAATGAGRGDGDSGGGNCQAVGCE